MMLQIEQGIDRNHRTRFAAATDGERMREVMQDSLLAANGACSEVVACEVEFARRSEGRSLFQYAVGLRDRATGVTRNQRITAVSYGHTRTREIWEQARELGDRHLRRSEVSALPLLAYVAELDLLLQVFPFDHRLPALAPLLEGPCAMVESALLGQFDSDDWQLTRWSVETVRYRVTLRACLRLTVGAGAAGSQDESERVFFAKVYASAAEAERAWNIQRDVWETLQSSDAGVHLPTPIAYFPDQRLVIQEAIPGPSLFALQRGKDREAARQGARQAAQSLATLHRLGLPAPMHRLRTPRAGAFRTKRAAHRLCTAQPQLARLATLAEGEILSRMAMLPELSPLAVHGDFKPPHVILRGERAVLLDLDKFAVGEPMLDVISMMRRLGSRGDLAGVFAREYFTLAPAEWEERLAPHYAAYLLEDAAGLEHVVRSRQRSDQRSDAERISHALETALEALQSHAPLTLLSGL